MPNQSPLGTPSNKPVKPSISGFIIASESYDGAGFAKLLHDEGYDVILAVKLKDDEEKEEEGSHIMENVVEQMSLDDVFEERKEYKEYIWLWDLNHNSEMADQLRKEGFLVSGGQELSDKMEHDRAFGISLIEKAGLESPPYHEFQTAEDGMEFLDENLEKSFVLKPDEPDEKSWVTTVPNNEVDEKANRELYSFLQSVDASSSYILQERKKGVEINVDVFLFNGKPFFAHANFECKQKLVGDQGKQVGCAGDTDFHIPLDCKIMDDTLNKVIALPEFRHYTGPVDLNLIVGDNHYWFLEFCARQGYNSSPNVFMNLALIPFGEVMEKWLTGDIENFYQYFRPGFGATITLRTETQVTGLPVMIEPEAEKNVYHFSTYEDDGWKTTGYMEEVVLAMGHAYNISSAFKEAEKTAEDIHFAGRFYRNDLHKDDFPSAPVKRYQDAVAMGLFGDNSKHKSIE